MIFPAPSPHTHAQGQEHSPPSPFAPQAISKTLADLSLEVHKAEIDTEEGNVFDQFYITDRVRGGEERDGQGTASRALTVQRRRRRA